MKAFFSALFASEPAKIVAMLGQGCYPADLLVIILQHTPPQKMMTLVQYLTDKDFIIKIEDLTSWAKSRLD